MIEEEGTSPVGLSPLQKVKKVFGKNIVIGIVIAIAVITVVVALR